MISLHLFHLLLAVAPVLFIGHGIYALSFLLHALEQFFVLHVSLVLVGLRYHILHLYELLLFLTLL